MSLRWRDVYVVEVARASGAGPAVPRDEARYEIVVHLQCIRIARYAAAQEIVVQVEAHLCCVGVYLDPSGVPGVKIERCRPRHTIFSLKVTRCVVLCQG